MKRILDTQRLYLREFVADDANHIMDLNANPNVIRYTADGTIESLEKCREVLATIIIPQYKNRLGRWAVHLKANDEFVGWCGLKYIEQLDETDLGYRFFENHWGKGYATESAKACLDHGFNTLNLEVIVARAAIENINSHKVLRKLGMKFEKEDEEHGDKIYKYRLTNADYQALSLG